MQFEISANAKPDIDVRYSWLVCHSEEAPENLWMDRFLHQVGSWLFPTAKQISDGLSKALQTKATFQTSGHPLVALEPYTPRKPLKQQVVPIIWFSFGSAKMAISAYFIIIFGSVKMAIKAEPPQGPMVLGAPVPCAFLLPLSNSHIVARSDRETCLPKPTEATSKW